MDLRNLPHHLSPSERCETRRRQIEQECDIDLSALQIDPEKLGNAEERNCEQMFGYVPIPVGYAGPLHVTFSSGECADIHLPLATTEGALVASVNRGCKALRLAGGVHTASIHHGISRSIALRIKNSVSTTSRVTLRCESATCMDSWLLRFASEHLTMTRRREPRMGDRLASMKKEIQKRENEWKSIGEATSNHLKILKYDIDTKDDYIFLTIYADTDEAMGMNMVTIAAEAIGKWLEQNINRCVTLSGVEERPTIEFITVAANVDSDKKPSQRTHNRGRGYEVTATATVPADILQSVLKTTPESLLEIAHAKLELGSEIAGAIGKNCHAANIVAALYIATGQDPAHIVEGSLTDTSVSEIRNPLRPRSGQAPHEIRIATRLPALLGGIRGGGTTLPAQSQCLSLLLGLPGPRTQDLGPRLHACRRLAESIGGAVLAGELSLLAALASNHLAKSHASLARTVKT